MKKPRNRRYVVAMLARLGELEEAARVYASPQGYTAAGLRAKAALVAASIAFVDSLDAAEEASTK